MIEFDLDRTYHRTITQFNFYADGLKFAGHKFVGDSFTNFLISESEQFVSQQSDPNQLSYDSMDSNLNVHRTKKSQKGKNFSPEKDCLLVSTWLNISKDPIT